MYNNKNNYNNSNNNNNINNNNNNNSGNNHIIHSSKHHNVYHRYLTLLIITSIPMKYTIYVVDSICNIWSDKSFLNTNHAKKQRYYTDILLILLNNYNNNNNFYYNDSNKNYNANNDSIVDIEDNNSDKNNIDCSRSTSSSSQKNNLISRTQLQTIGTRSVPIELTLLHGISNYIDVDINETRKYGMLIAQTYSKIVGNDIELFKEYVNVDKELEVIFSCISRSSHRNIDNNESRGNVGDDNNIDQRTIIITIEMIKILLKIIVE
jgi:hypothetical protein